MTGNTFFLHHCAFSIVDIIRPLVESGLYCNHLVCPSVCPSVRSHFCNRYLSFYWKKWLHIYFLFIVRLTN